MPPRLLLTLLVVLSACNPESECARYGDGDVFDVQLSNDGLTASMGADAVERARRMLKNELWTNWRFAARLFEPVEQEDGSFSRENLRLFSIFTDFANDVPTTFQAGTVPEGWEQGLEEYTTADTYAPWPEGPLPARHEYDVYLEALNPTGGNVRCGVGDTTLTAVR